MIGKHEWKGIRMYGAFLALVLGLYIYAGVTGWRFYNPDDITEHGANGGVHGTSGHFYHK